MVSFVVQKLVSVVRSHLLIFAFISIALGTDLQHNFLMEIYKDQSTHEAEQRGKAGPMAISNCRGWSIQGKIQRVLKQNQELRK